MLPVCEIFNSIDGEGLFTGHLAVFIRLLGCNLDCSYCDSQYSCKIDESKNLDEATICQKVKEISPNCNRITITGGEPLIHGKSLLELVYELNGGFSNKPHINIETNGSLRIDRFLMDNVTITMDCKSPSSGQFKKMLGHNYDVLRQQDVLKFVVGREDFEWLKQFLRYTRPKCNIFISPIFGKCEPVEIVELLKEIQNDPDLYQVVERCRVQVQLHKVIWNPDKRGV